MRCWWSLCCPLAVVAVPRRPVSPTVDEVVDEQVAECDELGARMRKALDDAEASDDLSNMETAISFVRQASELWLEECEDLYPLDVVASMRAVRDAAIEAYYDLP